MLLNLLKSKIHRATVTQADLHYEGSIGIAGDLLDRAGIREYEQVDVLNIHNGHRFTTYAIRMPEGSGAITINGAAARLAQPGDLVIVCAYVALTEQEANHFKPTVLLMDEDNRVKELADV
jgi:aspartate 1-decarboxylase